MKSVVRVPKQERSIEKKKRIIRAAYELFNSKGYYETNTAEIAKQAGVATGSVYSYFEDKNDIFYYVIDLYMDNIINRVEELSHEIPHKNLNEIVEFYIYSFIEIHSMSKKFHNELSAQCLINSNINNYYNEKKNLILEKILKILKDNNISLNSIHKKEQLFIISEIVNSVCHQFIYNNATIDKKLIITESIKDIIKIIK